MLTIFMHPIIQALFERERELDKILIERLPNSLCQKEKIP